jgi:hypothetical protein
MQDDIIIISDDLSGAIVIWRDFRYGASDTDILAQRITPQGDVQWDSSGALVCTVIGNQDFPRAIKDGSGGAFVTWIDYRDDGDGDVYVQNIDSDGNRSWNYFGVLICNDTTEQIETCLASDSSGGFFVAWRDARSGQQDIYAQRVDANGDTMWAADGIPVCTAANTQYNPRITADGSGGAIISWADARNGVDYNIYTQRIDADGDTLWQADGVPVCIETDYQYDPQTLTDGQGGAYIVWQDDRGAHYDIYAQRIDADGNVLWQENGIPICTAPSAQISPILIADDSGVTITWEDFRDTTTTDIYAQRVDLNGNLQWPVDGLLVCGRPGDQRWPQMVSDGSGGAIVTWHDQRSGHKWDVYAQHVDASGDTLMPAGGLPICTTLNNQEYPVLISSGAAGAIIAWQDARTDTGDVYAQKIVFDPAPHITSITDVPQDQGRQVAVLWSNSYLDHTQYDGITEYSIWRKDPGVTKLDFSGRLWDGGSSRNLSPGMIRLIERSDGSGGTKQEYWEYIGAVDAHHLEGYRFTAPTLSDSSASGTPYYSYFVSAHTADPQVFYDSAPDSGYSVDDIGPAPTVLSLAHSSKDGAKTALAGAGGSTTIAHRSGTDSKGSLNLSWEQVTTGADGSPETGPITYHLHADTVAFFTPGPATLITSTAELSYAHTDARIGDPATDLFYQVIVTDGSGNTSAGSNRSGEIDWALASTTGTDYAWLALALDDSALTMASDLEAAIEAHSSPETNCLTVSQWNAAAQTYTHYTTVPVPMGDFPLSLGLPCRVETDSAAVFTLAGAVPVAGSLSFQLHTTTGTDYTWITLPLELDTLTMASDLETHIEAHGDSTTDCLTVSQWNAASQTYTHYTTVPVPMGDFAIQPGRPYRVEVTAGALWPYTGKGIQQFRRALRRR